MLPLRSVGSALFALACAAVMCLPAVAMAAPGDVYWTVHRDQKFQYYAFAGDVVPWESADFAGTIVGSSATHDTLTGLGAVGTSSSFTALDESFDADLATTIHEDARVGVYHLLTNTLTVKVYVKGPAGTPYWIAQRDSGWTHAWRLGGLPGSLAPVNGLSNARFQAADIATTEAGGDTSAAIDTTTILSGVTGATIVVDGNTYSLARTITMQAPASISQRVCILGCMTAPATFGADASGHVHLQVYPYTSPLSAPGAFEPADGPRVRAIANPVRGAADIAFRANAGARTRVSVFDVRGRRVATLLDGPATGAEQHVAWSARGAEPGVYFVQVRSGEQVATTRLVRVR